MLQLCANLDIRMIPRLSICFAVSVLLHGMLLLSAAPAFRSDGKGYVLRSNDGTGKMVVLLEAASDRTRSAEILSTEKITNKPVVAAPVQTQPVATPVPTGSPSAMPSHGWLIPPPPEGRQQMGYRQMYEIQAKMQAMQQAQAFISRVQGDIEQSVNLHGEPVAGQCVWQANSTKFQCDSNALQRWMQPEADRLFALRSAMKSQSIILDGFTVGTSGDRSSITYQVHSATSDPTH
jgi:hypothetical protein